MTETGKIRLDLLTGERVEGELLSARLEQGAFPPFEAVRTAIDIGIALNEVHSKGIVHGVLSPATILLTQKGPVLLKPSPEEKQNPNYRSPEQVQGKPADSRSDIFTFGAILYEMLTGRRAFLAAPNTIDETILTAVPPAIKSRLPVVTAAEGAIAGCLDKDPAKRRQRIKNVVSDLKLARSIQVRASAARRPAEARAAVEMPAGLGAGAQAEAPPAPGLRKPPQRPVYVDVSPAPLNSFQRRLWILVAMVGVLAAASVAAVLLIPANHGALTAGYRLDINPPDNVRFAGTPAISPDGKNIAYTATGPEGKRMLWIRAIDEEHARVVPNTEGAFAPFWSPDSQYVAFFAEEALKKIKAAAADPPNSADVICPAQALPGGGSWGSDNTILFAPGLASGLSKVTASGGKPAQVTKLDASQSEQQHLWPQWLPDGKHFFFFVRSTLDENTGVYLGAIDSPRYAKIAMSESSAIYARSGSGEGYLIFIRDRSLVGESFDAGKLQTGSAPVREIASDVGAVESLSLSEISASNNGILIYQSAGKGTRHLVWMDRSGKTISEFGQPADWGPPRISPDGKRVAVGKRELTADNAHIWILSADDGKGFQLTDSPASTEVSPVWSPDGSKVAYVTLQPRNYDIYIKAATPDGKVEFIDRAPFLRHLEDWSRDGKFVLFSEIHPDTAWDVMSLNPIDRKISPIVDTIHTEGYPALSADMKWLAYQSNESGDTQIYVQPFENGTPGTKRIFPISPNGGNLARWRRDGGELYYVANDGRMMAVGIHASGNELTVDPPKPLFQTRPVPKTANLYDVTADGERFLLNLPMESPNASPIRVTTNWAKDLAPPEK